MDNFKYAADGAWQVLLVGVLLGAGLPAVFALGIRSLALGSEQAVVAGHDAGPSGVGRALAALCFLLVIVAVALGITEIVAAGAGKEVSFSHGYPHLAAKGK